MNCENGKCYLTLPCPFCGAEAKVINTDTWHMVMCNKCGVKTPAYDSIEKAVEAWNRRL